MSSFREFIIGSTLFFIVAFFLERVAAVLSRCWDDQFMINMFKVMPEDTKMPKDRGSGGLQYMFENDLMDETGWYDMIGELGRLASTPKPIDEDDDDDDDGNDDDDDDDWKRDEDHRKAQGTPNPSNANHMCNNGRPMYALMAMGFYFHI